MKTKAAILWEVGKDWSVEEIELDPPKEGEVLVKMAASGLCHSDEHLLTGDLPFDLPIIGGHEGAGVVEEVGPGVTTLKAGDHVVFGFIPSCGRCPSCSTGHPKLAGAKRIIAIDPLENKRERAMDFSATHTAASMEDALPLITDITWGTMANKVIMTMGVGDGKALASALALASKRGRVVITNIH